MNNMIWFMSSAFPQYTLDQLINFATSSGLQGIELCMFRDGGSRSDHIATHVDAEGFSDDDAKKLVDKFEESNLKFSLGFYENMIGGDGNVRKGNVEHLLKVIKVASKVGGKKNGVNVGTFVGYDHELGIQDRGFEKNLEKYINIFTPIIQYAEDLGVTVLYENCPMEGWNKASSPYTMNNLASTLAARKLMYASIPSIAHGETYDPSHDIWQHINPVDVLNASDISRIHSIHIKGSRYPANNKTAVYWGGLYPQQVVSRELAEKAGVPICQNEWDRHNYEPTLPGFGDTGGFDWRAFTDVLEKKKYRGPFVIENEAVNSKGTGNLKAIEQGIIACAQAFSPLVWILSDNCGYCFKHE